MQLQLIGESLNFNDIRYTRVMTVCSFLLFISVLYCVSNKCTYIFATNQTFLPTNLLPLSQGNNVPRYGTLHFSPYNMLLSIYFFFIFIANPVLESRNRLPLSLVVWSLENIHTNWESYFQGGILPKYWIIDSVECSMHSGPFTLFQDKERQARGSPPYVNEGEGAISSLP